MTVHWAQLVHALVLSYDLSHHAKLCDATVKITWQVRAHVSKHAEHVEVRDTEDKELAELERQITRQKKVTQVRKLHTDQIRGEVHPIF